jgi:hypothetical protein
MSRARLELEERLRELAPAFKAGIEPPDSLHVSIMARATAIPEQARRSIVRELSIAMALIVFVALMAFGFSRLHSMPPGLVKRSPSPSPVSGVIPWLPLAANADKAQPPKILWPDQAAQDIRQTVTDVTPVLLPSTIPAGLQAQLYDDASSFSVNYVATDGRKISFAIVVPNPAPGTGNVRQTRPLYRGVRADYQVDDATIPTSHRWLMWNEPGPSVQGQPGVPYFLSTEGLTESQFWTVANSVGPIPAPKAVRPCGVGDLYAVSNGGNGATGHVIYSIALANHSSTPCAVTGFPGLKLIDNQGLVVPLEVVDEAGGVMGTGNGQIASGVLQANQLAPVAHQGGAYAYVEFEWYFCGRTPPAISAVDLSLPGSSRSVRVPLLNEGGPSIPSRCDDPSMGKRLLLGPIQPPAADQVVTASPQWQVALIAPTQMAAGTTVDYTVTLTNISNSPIVFDTCPTYDEGFTPTALVAYQLNCGALNPVQPGASLTFAMRFTVSPKTAAGPEKFLWALRGPDMSASAAQLVSVTAR